MHREIVVPVRLNRTVVDDRALRGIVAFIVLYVGLFALGALGLVVDARRAAVDVQSFDALGAAAACLGNVGPGFGFAAPSARTLLSATLDGAPDRPHVARSPRDRARGGPADTGLLASMRQDPPCTLSSVEVESARPSTSSGR